MAKILRKSQGSISKMKCFCRPKVDVFAGQRSTFLQAKGRCCIIIIFKMLKVEIKFKYTR